jgi:hypothetical protein
MDLAGPNGLPSVLAAASGLFLLLGLWRSLTQAKPT